MMRSFLTKRLAQAVGAGLALLGGLLFWNVPEGLASDKSGKGWLGVSVQELTPSLREAMKVGNNTGLLVTNVAEGSPADEAGIREEDVIIEYAGKKVEKADDLTQAVRQTEPEKKVKVVVLRDGNRKEFEVTVGRYRRERSSGPWRNFSWSGSHPPISVFSDRPRLGVQVHELNNDLAPYFNVEPKSGALILAITKDSPAAKAGLKAGDVITKVGEEVVRDPDDLIEALGEYDEGDRVKIEYVRQGKTDAVEVELQKVATENFKYFHQEFRRIPTPHGADWEEAEFEAPEVFLRPDIFARDLIRKARIKMELNTI